jgi:hypothetical protein
MILPAFRSGSKSSISDRFSPERPRNRNRDAPKQAMQYLLLIAADRC